ncbi:hypothetical protein JKP88DRAFT_292051 [Tribonema minus]|uniref:Uncharacterized protein n=1 Tax=Tribonema minus TaxID=303371 RepID=A0A835ZI99_9STRA|nr:hypothetical protein JKP88DRAFT_292051 [Tribonema minus]
MPVNRSNDVLVSFANAIPRRLKNSAAKPHTHLLAAAVKLLKFNPARVCSLACKCGNDFEDVSDDALLEDARERHAEDAPGQPLRLYLMVDPDVLVTFLQGSAEETAIMHLPLNFERLYSKAEQLFNLKVEDFALQIREDGEELESDWHWTCTSTLTIHVISKSLALRAYTVAQGLHYLTGASEQPLNTEIDALIEAAAIVSDTLWPSANGRRTGTMALPYTSNNDVLDALLKDMTARICCGVDLVQPQQRSRPEYDVAGQRAHGTIDWVFLYRRLAVVVCEAKWCEDREGLSSHMGQLCAALKATREEYCRKVLGNRKRDGPDILLAKVPHVGILTNGLRWIFVRYTEATGEFARLSDYYLPVTSTASVEELRGALLGIVSRIVQMLRDQMEAINEMHANRHNSTSRPVADLTQAAASNGM